MRRVVSFALSCILVLGGSACGGGQGGTGADPQTGTEFTLEELRWMRDHGGGLGAREQEILEELERQQRAPGAQ